jgi:hypothetical protein
MKKWIHKDPWGLQEIKDINISVLQFKKWLTLDLPQAPDERSK